MRRLMITMHWLSHDRYVDIDYVVDWYHRCSYVTFADDQVPDYVNAKPIVSNAIVAGVPSSVTKSHSDDKSMSIGVASSHNSYHRNSIYNDHAAPSSSSSSMQSASSIVSDVDDSDDDDGFKTLAFAQSQSHHHRASKKAKHSSSASFYPRALPKVDRSLSSSSSSMRTISSSQPSRMGRDQMMNNNKMNRA